MYVSRAAESRWSVQRRRVTDRTDGGGSRVASVVDRWRVEVPFSRSRVERRKEEASGPWRLHLMGSGRRLGWPRGGNRKRWSVPSDIESAEPFQSGNVPSGDGRRSSSLTSCSAEKIIVARLVRCVVFSPATTVRRRGYEAIRNRVGSHPTACRLGAAVAASCASP